MFNCTMFLRFRQVFCLCFQFNLMLLKPKKWFYPTRDACLSHDQRARMVQGGKKTGLNHKRQENLTF